MSEERWITAQSSALGFNKEYIPCIAQYQSLGLQHGLFKEKAAHLHQELISEKVVHAKESGAFGTFTVTHDITKYTKAKIFSEMGKQTHLLAKFTTVGIKENGANTKPEPYGFALKFYTEDGNWDLLGNNTPIFFIEDPKKFGDFMYTQNHGAGTGCKSSAMMWDYWSLNPESLHQVMFLMSNNGATHSYRLMNGYGSHTFSLVNAENELVYVKFHFKTAQGIKNGTDKKANHNKMLDEDFPQHDLLEAIDKGDFPKWQVKIQVMTVEESKTVRFDPFDLTKIWSQKEFPLIDVGVMELNVNAQDDCTKMEQNTVTPPSSFSGISYSPDKILHGPLLEFQDAPCHCSNDNYEQMPVKRFHVEGNDHQRNGATGKMKNGGTNQNCFPNIFYNSTLKPNPKLPEQESENKAMGFFNRNAEGRSDHYTQCGIFYREVLGHFEKKRLITNIVDALGTIDSPTKAAITKRLLCHFFRADIGLGMAVATALGLTMQDIIPQNGGLHLLPKQAA